MLHEVQGVIESNLEKGKAVLLYSLCKMPVSSINLSMSGNGTSGSPKTKVACKGMCNLYGLCKISHFVCFNMCTSVKCASLLAVLGARSSLKV